MSIYTEVPYTKTEEMRNELSFLIVTATDIETRTVHHYLKPFSGYDKIIQTCKGNQTYYIGIFGAYAVVHVQCEMGSISRGSSITTTTEAIDCWEPKAVVMIGIAFGVDNNKQNIGDVLISEAIVPYEIKRVGKKKIIPRSIIPPSGSVLLNRFKNNKDWEHILPCPCNEKAKIISGHILSGDSLIDNLDYRNKLLKVFPNAKGGEMEGAGVSTAADNRKKEWIIVKGICDYADGNKNDNKDEHHKIAAEAATSLCLNVFSSEHAFVDLNFLPLSKDNQKVSNSGLITNPQVIKNVLFEAYSKNNERYYLVRENDQRLQDILNLNSIWVSGPTGCGKTSSIYRNLIQTNKDFIYIGLAHCINYSIEKLFTEIYLSLSSRLGTNINTCSKSMNLANEKSIPDLLKNHFDNREAYLLIEEIPIDGSDKYKVYVQKMIGLLISHSVCNPSSKIKFIFSSIKNPKEHIGSFQQKIHEKIKFIDQVYWIDKEIEQLLSIIVTALNIKFSPDDNRKVITNSKGSPRFVKKFIRNYMVCLNLSGNSVDRAIQETMDELN